MSRDERTNNPDKAALEDASVTNRISNKQPFSPGNYEK